MEVKTVMVPAMVDENSGKLEFGGRWCTLSPCKRKLSRRYPEDGM
jgi:hypothetical protein